MQSGRRFATYQEQPTPRPRYSMTAAPRSSGDQEDEQAKHKMMMSTDIFS
jgi:hypothetical protein